MAQLVERAFAMADIAGSARLWNRFPERMSEALARHDRIAAAAVEQHGGEIFKHTGDGFLATFEHATDAVDAMVAYQCELAAAAADPVEIRSRVGVHFGAAELRRGDWFGPTVNQLARLTDLVAPTHVVVSAPAAGRVTANGHLDLLGTFPIRDVPEPVPLYGVPLPDAIGPALTIAAGRGLPQFKTPFIGRADDVDALLRALADRRLVTIVGFGGMGKTRLAVEVAYQWTAASGMAANFVDLASTVEPLDAIADAVGLVAASSSTTNTVERIAKHVGTRPPLLVLDNCEHVVDETAAACDALLDMVPALRVLATTREALELDGETIYPLGSLDRRTAIGFLHDRARAAGAAPLPHALADQLCARVDDMPLGIELVVARLRHLPPDELVAALDAGLDELRARRRRRDPRHSTMRALIDWSYQLLSSAEQQLLLHLAQLPAPWRRPSVTAMSAPDAGALHALDGLVAKSLVASASGGHFRILEPIRQFAAEVLDHHLAQRDRARDALVDWGLAVVPPGPGIEDPVYDVQVGRELVDQLPNLRAALDAAVARDRGEDEARIMLGLWPLVVDGRTRAWFGPQIEDTLTRATDAAQRRPLLRLALMDTYEHHVDVAREQRLVALLQEVDPSSTSAEAGYMQANHAVRQVVIDRVINADPEPTRALLEKSARLAGAHGRHVDASAARLYLAFSYLLNGDHAEAIASAETAAELFRRKNYVPVAAMADATVALALERQGEYAEACRIAAAAVSLAEHARWESSVRTVHALTLGRMERHEPAAAEAHAVIDLALAHAVPFVCFDAAIALAAVRLTAGDIVGACEALDLAGVGRTPLTITMLFELAVEAKFELGLDRFVEALDPAAVDRRAERAAQYLRAAR